MFARNVTRWRDGEMILLRMAVETRVILRHALTWPIDDKRVDLPRKVSASVRAGATLLAMMGDQSLCKLGDVELKHFSLQTSCGDGKGRAPDLARRPGRRLAVGCGIPERGVADARQLVGQRTRRLVVVCSDLDLGGPVAQAVQAAARLPRHHGSAQHRA